jgi:hypothetical protein
MAAWNFIGGAYEAANPMQDDQSLINWYVEIDRNRDAKSPLALLGCPGLSAVNTSYSGEVRGVHVMPGGNTAYWVIGSSVVKMTVATPATPATSATFSFSAVGTMSSMSGQVCMRDNGVAGVLVIVDGAAMYAYLTKSGTFRQVSDPNVINPSRVAEIDGYLIWNSAGSQKFNVSPAYWNGTDAFDGTWFALKDDAADNLVTLIEHQRQLWLIGESTTEVWVNAGSSSVTGAASQPFARLEGAMLQVGCGAANTIVRTGPSLMWLGASERGQNYVVQTQGYQYQVVSNPALSYELTQYNVTTDAFAFTYTEEGHEFYVLTFPTQDVNWTYDMTTGFWHQRQSVDASGNVHRQRANCIANIAGQRLVGDYTTGTIWQQSRKFYSDGGNPLIATRRSAYIWDGSDRNRVRNYRLQIEFTPGVGLPTGQGSDPQMMLRWRDERGWSNQQFIPIGKIGETDRRAIARRLGASRRRVYEVSISDPVPRDIVGASLRAAETAA